MAVTSLCKDKAEYKIASSFEFGDVCIGEDGSHLLVIQHPDNQRWRRFISLVTGKEAGDFFLTRGAKMSRCAYIILQNGGQ